ncbi:MAG: phosphatidic acid phosphatase [Butyricicoccaceae bacterium]
MTDRAVRWLKTLVREKPHSKLLLYYVFYLITFFTLERVTTPKYIIHCALDDKIPFCEWFLLPYALWFLILFGGPLYFLMTDRRDFLKLCFIMFNGMTFCFLCYIFLPNGLELRPVVTGDNLLCRIAKLLYAVDTPTNVCPSIHVASSVAVDLVVQRSARLKKRYGFRAASFTLMVLITLSTMFLKQHSVVDVVCGIALSLVLCAIAYSPWMERHSPFSDHS